VATGDPTRRDAGTLNLVYEHRVRERDRLRDARREVTARLGPMPAAAGIVLGLFAGLPDHAQNRGLVWAALAVFVAMIAVSSFGIRLKAYRTLMRDVPADDSLPHHDWLSKQIEHERTVYTALGRNFDQERTIFLVVQWLLAAEVVLLVLSRLLP
jgi:hypothetical protein